MWAPSRYACKATLPKSGNLVQRANLFFDGQREERDEAHRLLFFLRQHLQVLVRYAGGDGRASSAGATPVNQRMTRLVKAKRSASPSGGYPGGGSVRRWPPRRGRFGLRRRSLGARLASMISSAPPTHTSHENRAGHCAPMLCHCTKSQSAGATATARMIQCQVIMSTIK